MGIRWGGSLPAVAVLSATIYASACSSSNPLVGPPKLQCAAQPSGALCIRTFVQGSQLIDVVAYLSASNSPLAHTTWRLVLSRYPCSPGTAPVAKCASSKVYPSPTRQGLPPASTFCRTTSGSVDTQPLGCHDTLAQEMGTHGQWGGLDLPLQLTGTGWLCVSEQIFAGKTWRAPPADEAPTPIRACSSVR